ncbi:hypothetical protein EG68_07925 [Paragonimus skrjabini miyazakii]|uniref:Uncharacterized protein n=1 Tax=Paragonimus skrjabini miyazakii TaxID=59628 RepID=A0A8S9YUM8_9TREM|nr:hypothetical protein EG68_07925 [Paragonimus skrjabini miyazakii]
MQIMHPSLCLDHSWLTVFMNAINTRVSKYYHKMMSWTIYILI